MNGPLIFTVIHIIKALECAEQPPQDVLAGNDTKVERDANATDAAGVNALRTTEQPDFGVKLLKKTCSCPCNSVPKIPVCGRTTNGLSRTFDSQCHLICHNQCGSVERYAITFFGECPAMPAHNRKNVFSNAYENRRIEYASPYSAAVNPVVYLYEDAAAFGPNVFQPNEFHQQPHRPSPTAGVLHPSNDFVAASSSESYGITTKPNAATTNGLGQPTKNASPEVVASPQPPPPPPYMASVTAADVACNCNHCPETRWIRLDYYPICGERNGQRRTFDSWCHFDCENKCVKRTGDSFLYMHKGACAVENDEEVVAPRTVSVASVEVCAACSSLCRSFYEPVCAKNGNNEYLSFKSRCHLRCHNQCHYHRSTENFFAIHEGACAWL